MKPSATGSSSYQDADRAGDLLHGGEVSPRSRHEDGREDRRIALIFLGHEHRGAVFLGLAVVQI